MVKQFVMRHFHRIMTSVLIVVICMVISLFYLISYNRVGKVYQDETRNAIVSLKRTFLMNTVNNLIEEIDVTRKLEAELYKQNVDRRYDTLSLEYALSDEAFLDYCKSRFSADYGKNGNLGYWTIFIWNNDSNAVLYDPSDLMNQEASVSLSQTKKSLSYYRIIEHGSVSCLFGVSKAYIDGIVQNSIKEKIRNMQFDNGSYIWVNQILNYDGGKDYALRLVHPNMPETEGIYLSTDMTDIKGNHPYLTELQGINENGELFYEYFFKELNSDAISEKLSYAKLYRDFNWVIAMGVQINEMEEYIRQTNERSKEVATKSTLWLLLFLIVVVVACLALIILIEKWRYQRAQLELENEVNIDPLTGAGNRRFGTSDLMRAYHEFVTTGSNPVVIMFDVDNFKYINDRYGHDAGDHVLREVVEAVQKAVRSADRLIRWGGDEFVGIFYGVKEEKAASFYQKILDAVSSLQIGEDQDVITPSISMGISTFQKSDSSFENVLKRADQAMYLSKSSGKNRYSQL